MIDNKLYSKLAESNLLDEFENGGKIYDDEKLMNLPQRYVQLFVFLKFFKSKTLKINKKIEK